MNLTPEKIAELDATAAERAPSLGKPAVVDGAQPFHAGALTPSEHIPGHGVTPTIAELYAKSVAPESAAVEPDPPLVLSEGETSASNTNGASSETDSAHIASETEAHNG